MLLSLSIAAQDPARVGAVLAEICHGEWLDGHQGVTVFARDARNSVIRIGPARPAAEAGSPVCCAIAVDRPVGELMAIAAREGWSASRNKRSGFEVVELCLENRLRIDLLTPDMQAAYRAHADADSVRRALRPA